MRRTLLVAVAAMTAMTISCAPAVPSPTTSPAVRASTGTHATVTSMSCASAGNCTAGGLYYDPSSPEHAFVITESNGQWGRAIEVPGLATLRPQDADIRSVSCAPAGGCAAGGSYQNTSSVDAFVISARNGHWGRLTTVFSVRRKSGAAAEVRSLSCPAPGSCAAGGSWPPFVVSEVNGRWGRAIQLPARTKNDSVVVSCASAGDCLAAWGRSVASERNGHWGRPFAVPGISALGTVAGITSASCTSALNCAVGGDSTQRGEVFVASERNGRWGKAIVIPGFAALNQEGGGILASLSCASAGNCVAGGSYAAPADYAGGVYEAFVASERNGRWGKAIEVPGIPPPSTGICNPNSDACVAGQVYSVSCAPGGHCAVSGQYDTSHIVGHVAFVASYENGHWGKATQIPGLASVDPVNASKVNSVSCTPSGSCAAGGSFDTLLGPAFVVDESNGTWGQAQTVRF